VNDLDLAVIIEEMKKSNCSTSHNMVIRRIGRVTARNVPGNGQSFIKRKSLRII
jgi:hypothetical protein